MQDELKEDGEGPRLDEWEGWELNRMNTLHMLHSLDVEPNDLGSTVRLGFKWAEVGLGAGLALCVCTAHCLHPEICGRVFYPNMEAANDPREGHEVRLKMPWKEKKRKTDLPIWCCTNCEVQGTAGVFDYWVGRFAEIPARLLQWEHDKSSRDYAGLVEAMTRAYGDKFAEHVFVTLVLYRRAS
jgi:hypothetical protein